MTPAVCPGTITHSPSTYNTTKCKRKSNEQIWNALNRTGWSSGFSLPFANEENKLLERKLEEKQKQVLILNSTLEDDTTHLEELKKHFGRIEYDIFVTQNLLGAKKGEVNSALNAYSFSSRICDKLKAEKDFAEAAALDYSERNSLKLVNLEERKKLVNELLEVTNKDAKILQKWREKTAMVDQQIQDVRNFQDVDQEYQIELEKKQLELGAKNKELGQILSSSSSSTVKLHTIFTRLGTEFQREHQSRKDLVSMWQNSIGAMKQRDVEMAQIAEEYYQMREILRKTQGQIDDHEKSVKDTEHCGRECKLMIRESERKIRERREQLCSHQNEQLCLRDQVMSARSRIESVSSQLKRLELDLRRVEEERACLCKREAKMEAELITLQARLEDVKCESATSDLFLKKLEEHLQKQEEECARVYEQLKKFRKFMWERHADKVDLEQELNACEKRIHQVQGAIAFQNHQNMKNDVLMGRLKATLFHTELHVSQLHARTSKIMNETGTHGCLELQQKIIKLKGIHKKINHDRVFTLKEIEHDELILSRLERHIKRAQENVKSQSVQNEEINIDCDKLECLVRGLVKGIRDEMVALSLQKVVLKRFQDEDANTHQNIFSLSRYRLTLEAAIKERKSEIDIHISTNLALLKSIKDDNLKLKTYIFDVNKHISSKKLKFQSVSMMLEVLPGSTFTERIVAVIRDRETLTAEKNSWRIRVEEAESELEALKNTVKLMDTANCAFKTSLAPAEPKSLEYEKVTEMESAEKLALVRRHQAKKVRLKLVEKENDILTSIGTTRQQIKSLSFVANAKMRIASMLSNELMVQKDKIDRWTSLTWKILLELKGIIPNTKLAEIEHDLKYRFLQEKLEFGIVMLEKLVIFCPVTKDHVIPFLEKCDQLLEIKRRIRSVGATGYKHSSRHAHHFSDTYNTFLNDLRGRSYYLPLNSSSKQNSNHGQSSRVSSKIPPKSKSTPKLPAIL